MTTLLLNYNKGYNKSPYISNKAIKQKLNLNNESTINHSSNNSRSNSNIDWNNDITPTNTITNDDLGSNGINSTQVNIIGNIDFENIELPEYNSITFPTPAAHSSSITFIDSVPSAPTSSITPIPSALNSLSYIDSKQSNNSKSSNF
ncbi:hypothetical protein K502DRAFT_322869 [Neoconidiobolus thromboides FSU 785]|nr:hypothetical protein K502DRAFT_322869 [Neoconidiobolus thromboides FSU 785]